MSSTFAQTPGFINALEDFKADSNSHDLNKALEHHAEESLAAVLDNDETFFFEHYLPIMLESIERKYHLLKTHFVVINPKSIQKP